MIIGSCPGRGYPGNSFIDNFVDMLEATGAEVRSFDDVGDIDVRGLDILIIHWPEKYLFGKDRLQRIRQTIRTFRSLGTCRIVWLVHDLDPVQPRANRQLIWPVARRYFARIATGILTLSPATLPIARAAIPGLADKPGAHIWLPPYRNARMSDAERAEVRLSKGIAPDETVIGYAGIMQLYKGVGALNDAFSRTAAPNLRLYLAGRPPRPEERPTIEAMAARDPRIILDFGHKDEAEFRASMNVIDKFVAPMSRYLHSASLVHALCVGSQVLTTTRPFSTALEEQVGRDWLQTYDGDLTPDMLDRFAALSRPESGPDLDFMQPENNIDDLAAFLNRVAAL